MRIIIIGDGKVGYKLAKQLSAEKYDIIMIDNNENKLRFAMDRLDIAQTQKYLNRQMWRMPTW